MTVERLIEMAKTGSVEQFTDELMSYLDEYFYDRGGCDLIVNDMRLLDDPVTAVYEELAKTLMEKYRYAPFSISLHDVPRDNHHLSSMTKMHAGLVLQCNEHTLNLFSHEDTAIIRLGFSWPEAQHGYDEHGVSFGSSHTTANYDFDMTSPHSLPELEEMLFKYCDQILDTIRPKSMINGTDPTH